MPTVESTIPNLLMQRVASLVLAPALPVSYPDIAFTPPAGAYLEVKYMPNSTVNLFLGNSAKAQHRGLLQITVVNPINKGVIAPTEIAGQIVAHFAKGTIMQSGAVKVKVYEKPSVGSPLQEPDRTNVPVTVRWRSFN